MKLGFLLAHPHRGLVRGEDVDGPGVARFHRAHRDIQALGRLRLEGLRHLAERPVYLKGLNLAEGRARNVLAEFLRRLRVLYGTSAEQHGARREQAPFHCSSPNCWMQRGTYRAATDRAIKSDRCAAPPRQISSGMSEAKSEFRKK